MNNRLIHFAGNLSAYIVILSVDRNPNYLRQTRESLERQNIGYDISQGSLTNGNLEGLSDNNCRIQVARECYEEGFSAKDVRYKSQVNYINALTMRNGGNTTENFRIVLEDDIIVSSNFLASLNIYLQAIVAGGTGHGTVLSLYTPYKTNSRRCELRYGLASGFYGTQGMVYSSNICPMFAEYMRRHLSEKPYDFLLADFCKEKGIRICWASLSLVQHMGQVSTGLGHHHQTTNFFDDVIRN